MSEAERKIFFIFPGQGSQYRGMGSDLVEEFESAREIFGRASEVVGYDMAKLCFADPDEQLDLTRYTQPALITHQMACLASFQSLGGEDQAIVPVLLAGHSLGEYTALAIGGALSFEDAVRLVQHRGELMSELGQGSMLATTLDLPSAAALAAKHYCAIGGCNLPEQTVIAGEDGDLDALTEDLTARFPRKRGFRLPTEGAFHTYLMVNAARRFRGILADAEFGTLAVDVLSNYTGDVHEPNADAIRSRLFFQLFNPVRWLGCMNTALDQGVDTIIEFGGGIGKGEGPEEKRANLENIVKKTLKIREYEAVYLPAINAAGIHLAAEQLFQN
ncbi:MAG: ACP S-malonyltransferase [Gammaproteobacteria bacterium]|nr:ACP S-malonyltransferase [Gammaproteobacteria bacterium]